MLSHRQNTYVLEFAIDQNGSRAARAAGYSATSAHVASSRLLRNDKVRAAIVAKQASMALKLDLSLERVLMSLAEACEQAMEQKQPAVAIAAAKEIGLLCGYYTPAKDTLSKVDQTEYAKMLQRLPDSELLELLEAESQLNVL